MLGGRRGGVAEGTERKRQGDRRSFPDAALDRDHASVSLDDPLSQRQPEPHAPDYFLTAGKVKDDVLILFDPKVGRTSRSTNDLSAPQAPGEYMLWTVLRDNRGGANWIAFPVHAR